MKLLEYQLYLDLCDEIDELVKQGKKVVTTWYRSVYHCEINIGEIHIYSYKSMSGVCVVNGELVDSEVMSKITKHIKQYNSNHVFDYGEY